MKNFNKNRNARIDARIDARIKARKNARKLSEDFYEKRWRKRFAKASRFLMSKTSDAKNDVVNDAKKSFKEIVVAFYITKTKNSEDIKVEDKCKLAMGEIEYFIPKNKI